MRILIVDDEPAARRRLALMLEELDEEVAGEAGDGVEAVRLVADRRPDVVLLDIHMREVDGLAVARHFEEPRPLVIFQTAYDRYAVQAFEQEALDYLLKPVTLERLRDSLDRARRRLESRTHPVLSVELLERLEATLDKDAGQTSRPRAGRLLVRDGASHRLLKLREVLRFTVVDGAVRADTGTATFTTTYTLDSLERRFGASLVRVSRAELVHMEHVRRVATGGDGSGTLELSNGSEVRVSRRRFADVKAALER